MNVPTSHPAPAPRSLMKPSRVAATVGSDPAIFSGLLNAQSASGSGKPEGAAKSLKGSAPGSVG